jgi:hypothetical protein
LCGGSAAVPRELSDLVGGTLDGSRTLTRAAFIDAISPLIPRPPKPSASKPKSPSATGGPASQTPPRGNTGGKTRRGKGARKSAAKTAATTPGLVPVATTPSAVAPIPAAPAAPATALLPDPEARWETDGGPQLEQEPGGFAEVLLGSSTSDNSPPRSPSPALLPAPEAEAAPEDDLPVGALFGILPTEAPDVGDAPATPHRPLDFSPADRSQNPAGLWRLVALVVAVAMVIAALMAHLTGLAPWR